MFLEQKIADFLGNIMNLRVLRPLWGEFLCYVLRFEFVGGNNGKKE